MVFKELPIAFPWYDQRNKQNRFRLNVAGKYSEIGLISPSNALLPFQFYKTTAGTTVTAWTIYNLADALIGTVDVVSFPLVRTVTRGGRHYFYYAGEPLDSPGSGVLTLPAGQYYSKLTISGEDFFSEIFVVPECSFEVDQATKFLKLEWYNDTDISPIFYNDIDGTTGKPFFRNMIFLDTFLTASEPTVEIETDADGDGQKIPTFQKFLRKYSFTDLVPDFLKTALVAMQIHDHIIFTSADDLNTGEVENVVVNITLEQGGAFSTVDITFEETMLVKRGCGENMT